MLSFGVFRKFIFGGLVLSPLIGIVIGLIYLPAYRFSKWIQALCSLVTLYVAASLFGFAVGLFDALGLIPNRAIGEVILENVIVSILGITITGYVLVLWPLAFLNHRLLKRAYRPTG